MVKNEPPLYEYECIKWIFRGIDIRNARTLNHYGVNILGLSAFSIKLD